MPRPDVAVRRSVRPAPPAGAAARVPSRRGRRGRAHDNGRSSCTPTAARTFARHDVVRVDPPGRRDDPPHDPDAARRPVQQAADDAAAEVVPVQPRRAAPLPARGLARPLRQDPLQRHVLAAARRAAPRAPRRRRAGARRDATNDHAPSTHSCVANSHHTHAHRPTSSSSTRTTRATGASTAGRHRPGRVRHGHDGLRTPSPTSAPTTCGGRWRTWDLVTCKGMRRATTGSAPPRRRRCGPTLRDARLRGPVRPPVVDPQPVPQLRPLEAVGDAHLGAGEVRYVLPPVNTNAHVGWYDVGHNATRRGRLGTRSCTRAAAVRGGLTAAQMADRFGGGGPRRLRRPRRDADGGRPLLRRRRLRRRRRPRLLVVKRTLRGESPSRIRWFRTLAARLFDDVSRVLGVGQRRSAAVCDDGCARPINPARRRDRHRRRHLRAPRRSPVRGAAAAHRLGVGAAAWLLQPIDISVRCCRRRTLRGDGVKVRARPLAAALTTAAMRVPCNSGRRPRAAPPPPPRARTSSSSPASPSPGRRPRRRRRSRRRAPPPLTAVARVAPRRRRPPRLQGLVAGLCWRSRCSACCCASRAATAGGRGGLRRARARHRGAQRPARREEAGRRGGRRQRARCGRREARGLRQGADFKFLRPAREAKRAVLAFSQLG